MDGSFVRFGIRREVQKGIWSGGKREAGCHFCSAVELYVEETSGSCEPVLFFLSLVFSGKFTLISNKHEFQILSY